MLYLHQFFKNSFDTAVYIIVFNQHNHYGQGPHAPAFLRPFSWIKPTLCWFISETAARTNTPESTRADVHRSLQYFRLQLYPVSPIEITFIYTIAYMKYSHCVDNTNTAFSVYSLFVNSK